MPLDFFIQFYLSFLPVQVIIEILRNFIYAAVEFKRDLGQLDILARNVYWNIDDVYSISCGGFRKTKDY